MRIYHNPNCSTSRFAVDEATRLGVAADEVLYLKTKPSRDEILDLISKLEDPPADLVRKDKFFEDQGLVDAEIQTPDQVADVLAMHPRLLQRPVLVRGDKAIIGRPKDRVATFLS